MKKVLCSLTLILIVSLLTVFGAASAADVPTPDFLITAEDMIKNQGWIKTGSSFIAGEGENMAYQFVPSGTISNGFGFVVDIPVETANYAVIRQYTNLVSRSNAVIFSHDSSFDYTKQYGSAMHTNKADERVITFDMTSLASKVKAAGEDSVKYIKITPWEGQSWEPEAGKEASDYYYNIYLVAFFAKEKDAKAYAKALEESLPDISVDKSLARGGTTQTGGTTTPTAPSAPVKVDTTELDKMVSEFKSKRVDNPFIKGYDNGTIFKPDGNMTRAEACTIIMRLLTAEEGIKGKYTSKFTDVKAGSWYYDAIAYLESKGYLDSYSGTFKPDQKITRAEFVELVYKMGKIADGDKEVSFTDVPVTHPRYEVIMAAAKSGLVNGKTATTFDPDGDIKRSEVVKVICMALGRTPTKEGIIKVDGFKDVPESHWAYPYVIEASYRHSLKVQEDGNEKWNEIVENELIIYPEYPAEIDRDYLFEISVTQGDKTAKIPVYDETRQPAAVRQPYGDNYRRFAEFAFQGEPVRIDVKVNESFSEYTLIPAIKDIPSTVNGNVISIYVNEPMQLILRLGNDLDSHNKMVAIFVDPPEENVPDKNDPNVVWVEGWYETPNGELHLSSGQTLYIAPGAVCNSRILGSGNDITITGRGMVRDPHDTRTPNVHNYNYVINMKNGKNIKVEGIKIVDCRFYHLYFGSITNGEIYNVKAFSNQISTDGFPLTGTNIYFHDSFADVGDDVFTGGGTNKIYENLLVGSTCGIFSIGGAQTNNVYKDISIFRADEAIFKNYYSKGQFTGATFENIYAVDCIFTPYFIASKDQGTGIKQFIFKNVHLNTPSGIDNKTINFRGYTGDVLRVFNGNDFAFDFENIYIDGKLQNNTDGMKVKIDKSEETTNFKFNVSVNQAALVNPLLVNTTVLKTPYVAPEKTVVPLAPGENTVFNPGFEEGAIGWSTNNFALLEISEVAHSGKYSMYVPTDKNEGGGVQTAVTYELNRGGKGEYLIEFYAKKTADSAGSTITASFYYTYGTLSKNVPMSTKTQKQAFDLTTDWQKYSFTVNIVSDKLNLAELTFIRNSTDPAIKFFIDDVSVTKLP